MTRDIEDLGVLSLGRIRHLDTLLDALDAGMPDDGIVYVEGTSFAKDVSAALAALPQAPEHERRSDVQVTVSPAPTCFHLPVQSGVLRVLRQFATRRAEPEICDHLVVYRGEEILALAHDAGGGDLLVARALSASVIERMRTILERDRWKRPSPPKMLAGRIGNALRRVRARYRTPAPLVATNDFGRPTFPLVVIERTSGRHAAGVLFSEGQILEDVDVILGAEFIVDVEGRRVAVRTPRLHLEVANDTSPIPCGFCFERAFTPPRFPPRCDLCAAQNLCWYCRERTAGAAPFSPDAPVPRCDRCSDVDPESVALPAQPKITIRDRLASLTWVIVIGAVVVLVVRACGRQ